MKLKPVFVGLLLFGLSTTPLAHSETPPDVVGEVTYLLAYLKGSGCQFYRNGTWYDANAAHGHLLGKYNYLSAGDMIATTEDFIEKAASRSSLSHEPYRVWCSDRPQMTTNRWLRDELKRFRKN